ncbi:Xaa-Pro aminopeptidase [soil metagenome]
MNHRLPAFILSFILFPLLLCAQWDDKDQLSTAFHQQRRAALRELLPPKSCAVFFANPVRNRSNDVDFQYSQNPNFYYLTGYTEPNALILIFKEPRNIDGNQVNEILFVQERNAKEEIWTGQRLGVDGAKKLLGINAVYNGKDFNEFGIDFSKFEKIFVGFPEFPNQEKNDNADLADLVNQFRFKTAQQSAAVDSSRLQRFMAELREVKQAEELILIQKAIDISIAGFTEMIKIIKPGMTEYQAQAIVEFYMKKYGSEYQGYGSIAGGGKNSCVLHYTFNRKELVATDMLLADMGAEYHGYTADITRTVPVDGNFSTEERAIYQLVLDAQNAGFNACRPGNIFSATQIAAKEVIAKGLMKLGIITKPEDVTIYFMHGTSHYLGLDVHDAGTYGSLKPGTIITVEPGIYIPSGSACDPKWWNIGVRIEDDVLITEEGFKVLSIALPREIDALELLMKQTGELEPVFK